MQILHQLEVSRSIAGLWSEAPHQDRPYWVRTLRCISSIVASHQVLENIWRSIKFYAKTFFVESNSRNAIRIYIPLDASHAPKVAEITPSTSFSPPVVDN